MSIFKSKFQKMSKEELKKALERFEKQKKSGILGPIGEMEYRMIKKMVQNEGHVVHATSPTGEKFKSGSLTKRKADDMHWKMIKATRQGRPAWKNVKTIKEETWTVEAPPNRGSRLYTGWSADKVIAFMKKKKTSEKNIASVKNKEKQFSFQAADGGVYKVSLNESENKDSIHKVNVTVKEASQYKTLQWKNGVLHRKGKEFKVHDKWVAHRVAAEVGGHAKETAGGGHFKIHQQLKESMASARKGGDAANRATAMKIGRRGAGSWGAPKKGGKRSASKAVRHMPVDIDTGKGDAEDIKKDAPYYVAWYGQSYEWYGDDDMKNGRYKPKGDGGRIVAINVPTYQQAQKIVNSPELKNEIKRDSGKRGGHYYIDGADTIIGSMSELDTYQRMELKYDKPRDYKNSGKIKEAIIRKYRGEDLEESVQVNSKQHKWGKMITVRHGDSVTYPLHPEHQKIVKNLEDGQSNRFKDETNSSVTVTRHKDVIHMKRSDSNLVTKVPRKHF